MCPPLISSGNHLSLFTKQPKKPNVPTPSLPFSLQETTSLSSQNHPKHLMSQPYILCKTIQKTSIFSSQNHPEHLLSILFLQQKYPTFTSYAKHLQKQVTSILFSSGKKSKTDTKITNIRRLLLSVQTTKENSVLETEGSNRRNVEQTEMKKDVDTQSLPLKYVKAIRIHSPGGPEVLKWEVVPVTEPKEHEVKIKVQAVTLTPYDISVRKGEGAVRGLPLTPGCNAVGEVVAVGAGVTTLKVGDTVAHIGDPQSELGTYAEEFILPASSAIPISKELSRHTAGYIASVLRSGLTTVALVNLLFRQDDPNFWVLVHTVNNEIAEKLCFYLRYKKANVIATMEGPLEQNEIAQLLVCRGVHVLGLNNVEDDVNRITNNNGVDVVYLSLEDNSTFKETEKCLKRRGQNVYYMHTYLDPGPAPIFSVAVIKEKSIFPRIRKLDDLIPNKEKLLDYAKEVFEMVRLFVLFPNPKCEFYEMEYAADAHSSWESGSQANPIVLYLKDILQPGGSVVPLLSEGVEAEAEAEAAV